MAKTEFMADGWMNRGQSSMATETITLRNNFQVIYLSVPIGFDRSRADVRVTVNTPIVFHRRCGVSPDTPADPLPLKEAKLKVRWCFRHYQMARVPGTVYEGDNQLGRMDGPPLFRAGSSHHGAWDSWLHRLFALVNARSIRDGVWSRPACSGPFRDFEPVRISGHWLQMCILRSLV
jgi:hypothetical protein